MAGAHITKHMNKQILFGQLSKHRILLWGKEKYHMFIVNFNRPVFSSHFWII